MRLFIDEPKLFSVFGLTEMNCTVTSEEWKTTKVFLQRILVLDLNAFEKKKVL